MTTTIKAKAADFTIEQKGGGDFRMTLHAKEAVDVATAYFSRSELEHIRAAITTALAKDEPAAAPKGRAFTRTTQELEETLDEEEGQVSGSWDPIAEEQGVQSLILTKYIATDHSFILVFNNGHVEFLEQAEPLDGEPMDGDLWDVSRLGWS